jgi:hypothetical protein
MDLLTTVTTKTVEALRALAGHLNHDQITGTLETIADDLEAAAAAVREIEHLADVVVPEDTAPAGKHA